MDKREALEKVEQMEAAEKIARLSETAMGYVKNCVEQAASEEQEQSAEARKDTAERDTCR